MIGQLLDRRYRITEVLGTAEFGQLYLAKDTRRPGHPECFVKHLRPATNDPKVLENARRLFDKEAEMLEKLGQHDQIPQLFAYFEENHEFYLVEEFIPGHSLANEILPGKPLPESQVVNILKEVLEILVFVHGHGVIHRDIKPSNLIRRHPDGKLVLIDFGAVKEIGSQMNQGPMPPTVRVGTLEYMPIEQFQYNPQFNSDIYALGTIAIQALTGLPVYDLPKLRDAKNPTKGEIYWRHLAVVTPELADILDKMVRHDYRMRYQSAEEVIADLIKSGDRSKIHLPKLTIYREEVERRVSHRGEISVVGRNILDALRTSLELQAEEAQAIEEEVLKPYEEYKQKIQRYERALVEALNEENPLSVETRDELKRLQQILGLKDEEVAKIEERVGANTILLKLPHPVPQAVAKQWSRYLPEISQVFKQIPPAKFGVGMAIGIGAIALTYGTFQLPGMLIRRQQQLQQFAMLDALYKDRNYEQCLQQATQILNNSNPSQEIQNLVKQCEAGINWKNIEVKTLTGHSDAVGIVAFSPDGKTLASGSKDKTVKFWNVAEGKVIRSFDGDGGVIWAIAFSPDSRRFATGSSFGRIMLWNPATGELMQILDYEAAIWAVTFSPNSRNLASAYEDKTIRIWNVETGKQVQQLSEHSDYVYSVAISSNGKTLVSGSKDGTVKIWNMGTGTLIHNLRGHSSEVRSVAISPDGKRVVSGGYDNMVKIWNTETGELIRTLQGHKGEIVSVAISPDGKIIASGSRDGTIKLWNLNTGELINTLSGHSDEVYSVAFSPNGKMLASAGKDNMIKLWRR